MGRRASGAAAKYRQIAGRQPWQRRASREQADTATAARGFASLGRSLLGRFRHDTAPAAIILFYLARLYTAHAAEAAQCI